jgi:septal ring factor EnvC (AmiA/AmiB activator)
MQEVEATAEAETGELRDALVKVESQLDSVKASILVVEGQRNNANTELQRSESKLKSVGDELKTVTKVRFIFSRLVLFDSVCSLQSWNFPSFQNLFDVFDWECGFVG